MSTKLNAKMTVSGYEEVPLELPEGLAKGAPRLARLKLDRAFKGDLEGKGAAYFNSNSRNDGGGDPQKSTARFAGLTYFSGEIKGVGKGTIVFIEEGTWDPATGAVCEWVSDPNSGTGDFAGLKAKGSLAGKVEEPGPVTLEIQG